MLSGSFASPEEMTSWSRCEAVIWWSFVRIEWSLEGVRTTGHVY
jgi:hypothetical protein